MALPTRTQPWVLEPIQGGNHAVRITFTGADQVSDPLSLYPQPIDTFHVFGTFGGSSVSILGFNADPAIDGAIATPQVLHRADSPSSTLSAIGAEALISVIETPRYIVAQSNGSVTSVVICGIFVGTRRG